MSTIEQKIGKYLLWLGLITGGFIAALVLFRFVVIPTFSFNGGDTKTEQANHALPKTTIPGRTTTLSMANVFFRMTDKLSIKVNKLTGKLAPTIEGDAVNFDDIKSFRIEIAEADAKVGVGTMRNLFNDYVFNFKNSPVRKIQLELIQVNNKGKKEPRMKVSGEMKLSVLEIGAWIGFEMVSRTGIDSKTNELIIDNDSIKTLGNPYTKTLMGMVGLELEKLIQIPPGRGLRVVGNKMYISPFKIFPPPTLWGKVKSIKLDYKSQTLDLIIQGDGDVNVPPPPSNNPNYLMVRYGEISFGRMTMSNAEVFMMDADSKDDFDFFLKKYTIALGKGTAKLLPNGSVMAFMPDYNDL